nr:MOSC domain-containing protein [Roseibium litorale]
MRVIRGRKLKGRVEEVLKTRTHEDFNTFSCEALTLGMEGIPGDLHSGFSRCSGGREPWYPRGTEMCNERQISVLSIEELAVIAGRMEISQLHAGWIGGNISVSGIPSLSLIPPRTRLVFEGGAVVRVDGDNAPCRYAGKSIAKHFREREGLDLLFPKVARRLRGLVGFVERPGVVKAGEEVTAHVPEQWIYDPA